MMITRQQIQQHQEYSQMRPRDVSLIIALGWGYWEAQKRSLLKKGSKK